MLEMGQSGSEGGVALTRHSYPYVRLRRRLHCGVEFPVRRNVHPPGTEGYCVVATRGGELLEVNNPSVTT
jgi:hypothetical protein